MTKKKRYVVANPRDIPSGIPIFRIGEREWFEGDDYVPEGHLKELQRREFVKEVK